MSDEDQLVAGLIGLFGDYDARTEVQYNYYGDRGVVDLVIVEEYGDGFREVDVIEVKSDAAIDHATGANEICRQFTKQQEYFERGQDEYGGSQDAIFHRLIFTPTDRALQHVWENRSLYLAACGDYASVRTVLDTGDAVWAFLTEDGWMTNHDTIDLLAEYVSEDQIA